MTKTEIANMALSHVGGSLIADYATDTTPSAIQVRLFYPTALQEMLELMGWTHSTKRATLSVLLDTPRFDYPYAFQLPSDCLEVQEVFPKDQRWKIEARTILGDFSEIDIIYSQDLEDTGLFRGSFVAALALLLASKICPGITRDLGKAAKLYEQSLIAWARAAHHDSRQGSILETELDTLTRVRIE